VAQINSIMNIIKSWHAVLIKKERNKERKKERKKEKIATQLHLQCKTFNNNLIHVILGSAKL